MTENIQAVETYLFLVMMEALERTRPREPVSVEDKTTLYTLAAERAEQFALVSPEIFQKLTKADITRIDEALHFHYDMTEKTDEDEANKALIHKIDRLVEERALPAPRRPRVSR